MAEETEKNIRDYISTEFKEIRDKLITMHGDIRLLNQADETFIKAQVDHETRLRSLEKWKNQLIGKISTLAALIGAGSSYLFHKIFGS